MFAASYCLGGTMLFLLSAAWSAVESCILQVDVGTWTEFGSRWPASCWPCCCPNFCQTSRDSAAEETYRWWQVTCESQLNSIAVASDVRISIILHYSLGRKLPPPQCGCIGFLYVTLKAKIDRWPVGVLCVYMCFVYVFEPVWICNNFWQNLVALLLL